MGIVYCYLSNSIVIETNIDVLIMYCHLHLLFSHHDPQCAGVHKEQKLFYNEIRSCSLAECCAT